MVRLSVVESSPLRLESRPDGVAILKDDMEIACGQLVESALALPGAGLHHRLGALHL